MRKGSRKMWWVVPCKSKRSLRAEALMDIEEILKMKLETIKEEPETINEENVGVLVKHRSISKKVIKKMHMKVKMGKLFVPHLSLRESYVLFMTGFSSRGGLSGLPRY